MEGVASPVIGPGVLPLENLKKKITVKTRHFWPNQGKIIFRRTFRG